MKNLGSLDYPLRAISTGLTAADQGDKIELLESGPFLDCLCHGSPAGGALEGGQHGSSSFSPYSEWTRRKPWLRGQSIFSPVIRCP